MKTIKTLVSALMLTAAMTAQAQQQVMTVKTGNVNDKFALNGRFVLDLRGKKVQVRSGQQKATYAGDATVQIYLMPTSDAVYNIEDGMASLYVPEDMHYSKITYTRDFANTDWQILYLPLKLSYDEWRDDFDVAKLNAIHQSDTDNDGVMDETALEVVMLTGGCTEPNTPYVIRAHSTGPKTISQTEATLYATMNVERVLSNWNTYFTVKGTYNAISANELDENTLYDIEANTLHVGGGDGSLDALRWYITVTDRDGNDVKINRIRIYERDDENTGIEQVEGVSKDEPIYDLSGRQVKTPAKGIYIKGGKKVMLR